MVMPIMLPTAEGSAVPIRKKIQGFRIRRDIDPDCDFSDVPGTELEPPYPSSEKEGFLGSLLGKARKRGHPVEQHPIESAGQQVPQQHGLPLAGWILAARSFGPPNGQFSRLVGAVLRHPKWLVAGGVVYQGQKALRSEAFRRAARFWYRIGPLVVHYKFTRWWLTTTGAPLEKRDAVYGKLHERYSPVAMNVALNLKGLYVKLAQVVSSRPDFVPLPYISLFVAAQDSLPQWPIEEVTELIDDSLRGLQPASSASLSYETVFEDIDAIALGSAAIGQCHRARIKSKYARELLLDGSSNSNEDNGGEDETLTPVDVAVKVMHPGAEERFKHDFSVFRTLCRVALTGWEPILDELHRQIMSEFDYRKEARSLAAVRDNMHHSPFRKSIRVPQPVRGLCSKELLVMELLDGDKLSDSLENELKDILGADRSKKLLDRKRLELVLGKDKLAALESVGEGDSKGEKATEGNVLAECGWGTKLKLLGLYRRAQRTIDMLVDVQGYQMLKDGVFQGDPHPGKLS
jgi:aarF domain-containing kinase